MASGLTLRNMMSSDFDDDVLDQAVFLAWEQAESCDYAIPSVDHYPREIAVVGRCILHCKVDFRTWSGVIEHQHRESYWSPVLENPTWLTVLREFDKAIMSVGDYHHVFLEGVVPTDMQHDPFSYDDDSNLVGIPIYEFCTGS